MAIAALIAKGGLYKDSLVASRRADLRLRMLLPVFLTASSAAALCAQRPDRPADEDVVPVSYAAALDLLHERSPDLQAARAGVRQLEARATQTLAGVLPTFELTTLYLRTEVPSLADIFGPLPDLAPPPWGRLPWERLPLVPRLQDRWQERTIFDTYLTSVLAQQPLVNVDAWLGRMQARLGVEAAEAGVERAAVELELALLQAYFAVPLAAERLAALREALEAAEATLRQARGFHREGLVPPADVFRAQVEVAEVRAELAGAVADSVEAQAGLRRLLAVPDGLELATVDEATLQVLPPLPEPGAARDAIGRRADLRAGRVGRQATEMGVQVARAAFLPRLNAFGGYTWIGDHPFAGDATWSLGVHLSWTPFAGLGQVGQVRAARAELAEQEARLTSLRLDAERELHTAWGRNVEAAEQFRQAESGLRAASEALRLARGLYREGLAPITELLEAQAALRGAATARAAARYQRLVTAGEYLAAAGAWEPAR